MDINELKNSKYFCMAPFVHIRNVSGIPSPCCMIKENLIDCHTPRNLNSAFISPEWENFRQEMMKNKFNPNCTNCYIEEDNNLMSLRKNLNEHHLSFSNIKNPKIRDIDMAMSNKCNFKCVTCGIDNSSAWYDEEKLLKDWADKAQCYKWMHLKAHEKYRAKNAWFTIPVIIISTLTGTANFAQDRFGAGYKQYMIMTIGGFNILAGIITSLVGDNKMSMLEAASAGAWIHGDIAKKYGRGLISEDLIKGIPSALKRLKKFG